MLRAVGRRDQVLIVEVNRRNYEPSQKQRSRTRSKGEMVPELYINRHVLYSAAAGSRLEVMLSMNRAYGDASRIDVSAATYPDIMHSQLPVDVLMHGLLIFE